MRIIIGLVIVSCCGICACAAGYEPAINNREVVNFNRDWKFIRQDVPGAEKPEFDDSNWQDVGLPHTYNEFDTFDKPPHPSNGDGGWGGKTWYRKHFTIDPKYAGREIFIEFEAARTVAKVWLNGKHLGDYASGFSSFAFDITNDVNLGGKNVLAVMVDDTEGENIVAGNLSHWQPVLGGLYRNVRLHFTDKLHVSLPFYSNLKTEGVYFATPKADQRSADFRITTEVQNHNAKPMPCELKTEVVNDKGKVVLELSASHEVPANGLYKFDQTSAMAKPHLWSLDDPYLYTVYSTVKSGDKAGDVCATPLGVRTIGFDHEKSRFLLNGDEVILKGWGQKPNCSWPGLGAALPDWLLFNDIKLMKDTGGNIVRWGHCAGPIACLEAGDRLGYLQWQPNISGESDYKGEILAHKLEVTRDLIIRDRNHPSIVFWEGNNRGDIDAGHTKDMKDVVLKWDWINPRPFATRGPYKTPERMALQDFSINMNGSKNYVTDRPIAGVESEYYRPESPRKCWDLDSPPFKDSDEQYWRTQFDASREFVKGWKGIVSRGGGVKWHFTDDTTHCRLGNYAMARLSGTLDATRLPKDMNGALLCIYRDDPQIHIMGHWNYAKTHTVDVYCNCDTVELFLNDKSLGKKPVKDWRATWENVEYVPGTLKAIGYNGGSPDCVDERKTATEPAKIVLDIFTNPNGMRADRADVALITATVVDKNGFWHPTANNKITFAVLGPAVYKGGYNDTIRNTTNKPSLLAEAGKIRVSVRSTNKPGKVTVTATADGLETGKVEFEVLDITAPSPKR